MAVTDLTDSLPYWARTGQGYGGGAGPTGGPGTAPQGAGGSAAWLQYLQQMFGISPANAAEVPPDDHGDGNNPPVSPFPTPPAPPAAAPPAPPVAAAPPPAPPVPFQPKFAGSQPSQGGGYPAPAPGPMATINPNTDRSPLVTPPQATINPNTDRSPLVPGPMAGGAGGQGATSNPRFIGIDAPNFSPQSSMRGGPQGTALNLAGLFGGGQPAAAAPARAAGPMAKRTAPSSDDWDIDEKGDIVPNYGPGATGPLAPGKQQMSPDELASVIHKPDWWKSLGRPDMTSGQLASAIHKPNWYRNV